MALFGRVSKLRSLRCFTPTLCSITKIQKENKLSPRYYSTVPEKKEEFSFNTFGDVKIFIDSEREAMVKTNPFFPIMRDASIPAERRMAFTPYMIYFALSFADVMDHWMRIEKPENELNEAEKRINSFANEDNFHYNFYLRDLHTLGWTFDKFGSVEGVLRHVWASESIPIRKLIYTIVSTLRRSSDPLVALTVAELLEGGLYDLFTTIYAHIATAPQGIPELEYFGEKHVLLEQDHTVTTWFATEEVQQEPVLELAQMPLSSETAAIVKDVVPDVMNRFGAMYYAFYDVVKRGANINPEKYKVKGTPPISKVTTQWKEVTATDRE